MAYPLAWPHLITQQAKSETEYARRRASSAARRHHLIRGRSGVPAERAMVGVKYSNESCEQTRMGASVR